MLQREGRGEAEIFHVLTQSPNGPDRRGWARLMSHCVRVWLKHLGHLSLPMFLGTWAGTWIRSAAARTHISACTRHQCYR